MDPITLGVLGVTGLISGISAYNQWKNSNRAMDASAEEKAKMDAAIAAIQDPKFDERMISPEQIRLLQKFVPETIPFLQEKAPELVKAASAGAMQGREAQLKSLAYMQRLMQQGYDPQTAVEMAQAQRAGSAEAASARASAMAEAQRRGFGGGPSFYQAGADQQAMDRLAMAQQNALAQAAGRRMQGAQQVGAMGSQIRGEDVALEQANMAAINAFNQRQAQAQRDWMQQQANVRNQASLYNIGEAQRVHEKNLGQTYQALVNQQALKNTLAQQNYNNAMQRLGLGQKQADIGTQQAMWQAQAANAPWQAAGDLATKGAMEYWKYKTDQDKMKKG